VEILLPQRGEKARLVEMAMPQRRERLPRRSRHEQDRTRTLQRLQASLGLRRLPQRMECYDISDLGGTEASLPGHIRPRGAQQGALRRYRIKTVEGIDDYAMMHEVLSRRLRRGVEEQTSPT